MLDKSLPYYSVLMVCDRPEVYPRYELAPGFRFASYRPGSENDWARIHHELGQTESHEEALELFHKEFGDQRQRLEENCYFVEDDAGCKVATATLWPGDHFGPGRLRIHWVAVAPQGQGRGLAKALMTRLMDRYQQTNAFRPLYLVSQTWSYKGLHLYRKFGFSPYRGPAPEGYDENFCQDNEEAWRLIEQAWKQAGRDQSG